MESAKEGRLRRAAARWNERTAVHGHLEELRRAGWVEWRSGQWRPTPSGTENGLAPWSDEAAAP